MKLFELFNQQPINEMKRSFSDWVELTTLVMSQDEDELMYVVMNADEDTALSMYGKDKALEMGAPEAFAFKIGHAAANKVQIPDPTAFQNQETKEGRFSDRKEWEDEYDFQDGQSVMLKPKFEETPGEIFTLSQWDGNRGWIADEQGRGWYVKGYQLMDASVSESDSKLRKLSVPEKHQLSIARKTLKMSDTGALVMGGMTRDEAKEIIKKLTGKTRINEKAPPGMENWVKDRKASFKKQYGERWEEVLYATAWKQHNANESVNEDGEQAITPEEVVALWKEVFPNSSVGVSKTFDDGYAFKFRLAKDKSEVSNGIMDNDPLNYSATINSDGNWKEYRTSMYVAPPEGSYLAYSSEKFRKKSAKKITPAMLQKRFKQVYDFVASHANKLKNPRFDISIKLGKVK